MSRGSDDTASGPVRHSAAMNLRARALAPLTLALVAHALPAMGNSMVTHVWVAEQSITQMEPGPLRDIVADPALRSVIQNGAIYPDSGYSVRHEYGEWAHWESWTEPYLQWIRTRYAAEGYRSADARRHVAFLMGCAAHSMTDQTFDQYFGARAEQYDRTTNNLDIGSDAWLVVEHGVTSQADGVFWVDELPGIHAAVRGPAVTPAVLTEAGNLTAAGTRFLVRFGHTLYTARWREMPWAASHYMDRDTPGSYPRLVAANSAYWRFLWRRLQGDAPPGAPPIYSWPAPGQVNFPVGHEDIESRVVVTTPWGLDNATVNDTTVRILGPGDAPVPVRVNRYGDHGNTLMIRTTGDLAYNTEYRVELAATLRTLEGSLTGAVQTIGFRTRCAPDRLDECPALAVPLPTLSDPPVTMPRAPAGPDAGTGVIVIEDAGSDDVPTADAGTLDAGTLDAGGAPRAAPAGGGCGCRAAGDPSTKGAWALALLGVALLVVRRPPGMKRRGGSFD